MNYLKAEVDDFNGAVPMEVGAMKGSDRRGDKGKKGYGKGKRGKSFGGYEKGIRTRLRERQRTRDQQKRKDRHPIRASLVTAGHVASGAIRRASAGNFTFKEWRRFRVLPRVVTTTTAAKTTAAIQEVVSGEDEPC